MINVKKKYRHYKNNKIYTIDCLAQNPNTALVIVVYREEGGFYASWRSHIEFTQKFTEV